MTQTETQNEPTTTPNDTPVTPRPDHIPDKFWDADKGEIRLDALLKSYMELEKRLGQKRGPDAQTPEGRAELLKLLGHPDTPEEYTIDLASNVLESDPRLNARLHELGFTPAQAQAVYDLAAEYLVPLIQDLARDLRASADLDRLQAAFGGPAGWGRVARDLQAFGVAHVPSDVFAALSGTYDGIQMLYALMQRQGGDRAIRVGAGAPADSGRDVTKMMRDPKYWRDRDPAFIAKVTAAFEEMYGG